MKEINITTADKTLILNELGKDEICLLLGSGVSIWKPTQVISGQMFSNYLKTMIFTNPHGAYNETSIDPKTLDRIFNRLPFEIVNNLCPNRDVIESIIYDYFDIYQPNLIHEVFVALLLAGKISSIITTNYDNCLEGAYRKLQTYANHKLESLQVITNKTNITSYPGNPVIFKIHGSASEKGSIIFDLSQEGILDGWKRAFFHTLLNGKKLLIIGYSGLDFDICQEISLGKPRQVLWNFLNRDQISINSMILQEEVDLTLLLGDMRELIPILFQDALEDFSKTKVIDHPNIFIGIKYLDKNKVYPDFQSQFSLNEKLLWSLKILNMLCYVSPVINLSTRLINEKCGFQDSITEVYSQLGGALAPHGLYKSSGKVHLKAAIIAFQEKQDWQFLIRHINSASDAFRGNGNFLLAGSLHILMSALIKVLKTDNTQASYLPSRNQVLLLKEPYRLAKYFHLNRVTEVLQTYVLMKIKSIFDDLKTIGNYYDVQQLHLWAKRFDITESELYSYLDIKIPPPDKGYEQLYFPIGMMMTFRHDLYRQETYPCEKDYNNARIFLNLAKELELNPEIWKILRLIKKYFPKRFTDHDESQMKIAFDSCEYTLLQKLIKNWLGN